MNDTVECPYCEHENNMENADFSDLSGDNTFDWECEKCEKEFEVHVEFSPSYSSEKIVYVKCEKCGKDTRDPAERGRIFPFPKSLSENLVCRTCFYEGNISDFKKGAK